MSISAKAPINPSILSWAIKDLNLSPIEVAKKMGKNTTEEKILKWLSGEDLPTYVQLEKLAYGILKLPVAVFFFPEPPEDLSIKKKFRTLPQTLVEGVSYKTRIAVRKAEFFKEALLDLFGSNPSEQTIFKSLKIELSDNPTDVAEKIRKLLNINFELQKRFSDGYQAFNYYRETFENLGIFTFQLQLEGDRGFCLKDNEFPVIIVNSSDFINSKIFTLFHELSHILLNTDDIYKEIEDPVYSVDPIEVFCNAVASEILVPASELLKNYFSASTRWDPNLVERIASSYSVSKEVIMRKLLDLNIITNEDYKIFKSEFSQPPNITGHPTYYITKASSLGKKFISTVIEKFKNGKLNEIQTSNYLDIKIKNLTKLEEKVFA